MYDWYTDERGHQRFGRRDLTPVVERVSEAPRERATAKPKAAPKPRAKAPAKRASAKPKAAK